MATTSHFRFPSCAPFALILIIAAAIAVHAGGTLVPFDPKQSVSLDGTWRFKIEQAKPFNAKQTIDAHTTVPRRVIVSRLCDSCTIGLSAEELRGLVILRQKREPQRRKDRKEIGRRNLPVATPENSL